MQEIGVDATGVDNNEDMVEFCRDRGLRVELADFFQYLCSLPESSVDGIFAAQIVEHLAPRHILSLLRSCAEKLSQGGILVIETVNTNCGAALSNFYIDPTHVRPVPAEMLRFMLEQNSFRVDSLKFSSPTPAAECEALEVKSELPPEASFFMDYAVIATKTLD
jgi:O-antigen chain-terminating methyltransferase